MNYDFIEGLTEKQILELYSDELMISDDIRGPEYVCYCYKNGIKEKCIDYANWTYSMFYTRCPTLGNGTHSFWSCTGVCAAVGASGNYS